jgi:hypothetical protein
VIGVAARVEAALASCPAAGGSLSLVAAASSAGIFRTRFELAGTAGAEPRL